MGSIEVISEPMKPGPNGLFFRPGDFLEYPYFQQVIDIGFGIFWENLRENPLHLWRYGGRRPFFNGGASCGPCLPRLFRARRLLRASSQVGRKKSDGGSRRKEPQASGRGRFCPRWFRYHATAWGRMRRGA
jgi:hypothetical protein